MRFTAELLATGGNTTGFAVPDEVVEGLAAGRRPKVVVRVGEHTWRSSLATMDGRTMLGVSAANRQAGGIAAGQVHDVDLEVDDAPRTVDPPPALAEALAADPDAAAAWERLSYTHQREHAESIAGAKQDETRERRLAKTIAVLRGEA